MSPRLRRRGRPAATTVREPQAGDRDYRSWVGNPRRYDLMAAAQFSLLTALGLREGHHVLDVGCGSLRVGRLLIPYLLPGRYAGIEPEIWLIDQAIATEIGADQIALKRPVFSDDAGFRLTAFGRTFDYILAHSIFSHASADQVATCLREARSALAPEGVLVATYLPGEEDYAEAEWAYPRSIGYRPATFARFVDDAGLSLAELDWPHAAGQQWMAITHPGVPAPVPGPYLDPPRAS